MTTAARAIDSVLKHAHAFGYYSSTIKDDRDTVLYKHRINIANLLSYIPFVCIGVGIWRIYNYAPLVTKVNSSDFIKQVGYSNITRGVMEMLDVSFLMLAALDIMATALRILRT